MSMYRKITAQEVEEIREARRIIENAKCEIAMQEERIRLIKARPYEEYFDLLESVNDNDDSKTDDNSEEGEE